MHKYYIYLLFCTSIKIRSKQISLPHSEAPLYMAAEEALAMAAAGGSRRRWQLMCLPSVTSARSLVCIQLIIRAKG